MPDCCLMMQFIVQQTNGIQWWSALSRFIFVLDGLVDVAVGISKSGEQLHADDYAYFPADAPHSITSLHGAGILVFERRYALPDRKPTFQSGSTQSLPVLPCAGLPPLDQYPLHVLVFGVCTSGLIVSQCLCMGGHACLHACHIVFMYMGQVPYWGRLGKLTIAVPCLLALYAFIDIKSFESRPGTSPAS